MAAVALLPASMDPSIHSDVFARYERGALEIEHHVDDVRNFTRPSQGMKLRQLRMITLSVHRLLMTPGDTVLNRMLLAAYTSANALVTSGIGDFDSTVPASSTSGGPILGAKDPQGQTDKHQRPHQPVKSLLDNFSEPRGTLLADSRHPGLRI
jgi:hypothetical protein